MARKPTDKEFNIYHEFFEKPESFNNREFYDWVKKWGTYLSEYKDEFKYLEDDDWAEIRDRLLNELYRREDLNDEFDALREELEAGMDDYSDERIDFYRRWVEFMKRNRFEFDFSDELVNEAELKLDKLNRKLDEQIFARAKLERLKIELDEDIASLDDKMAEYYERTGIRPVLNALPGKNRIKGN